MFSPGKRLFYTALLVCFLSNMVSGYLLVYIDVLFLSTYPTSWLSYYFIFQSILLIAAFLLIIPLVRDANKNKTIVYSLILVAMLIACALALQSDKHKVAFMVSLMLALIRNLMVVLFANIINLSFDLRYYKKISSTLIIFSGLGNVVAGFSVPFITNNFGPHSFIVIASAVLLLGTFFLLFLNPRTPAQDMKIATLPIYKYPLFRPFLLIISLSVTAITIIAYLMRVEVVKNYEINGIAHFFGYFNSITNIAAIAVQFFLANKILKFFNMKFLLLVSPVVVIIFSVIFGLYGSLTTAVLLSGLINITANSFDSLSANNIKNVLPQNALKVISLFNNGISPPIGRFLGGLLLLYLVAQTAQFNSMVIIVIAILWIFVAFSLNRDYLFLLKKLAETRRFSFSARDFSEQFEISSGHLALESLQNQNPQLIRFGYSMLREEKIPLNVLKNHISSPYPDIRINAFNHILKQRLKSMTPDLLQQLIKETQPDNIWVLTDVIRQLNPKIAMDYADDALTSLDFNRKLSALLIIFERGHLDQIEQGIHLVLQELNNTSVMVRYACARLLGLLKIGDFSEELISLAQDKENRVALAAMDSIVMRDSIKAVPVLISRLDDREVGGYAFKSLLSFGSTILPLIQNELTTDSYLRLNQVTQCIVALSSKASEDLIFNLAKNASDPICNLLAKNISMYSFKIKRSPLFDSNCRQQILQEMHDALYLLIQYQNAASSKLQKEYRARFYWTCYRLLCWLIAVYRNIDFIQIMQVLLDFDGQNYSLDKRSGAIELLDNLISDRRLKVCVGLFELDPHCFKMAGPSSRILKIKNEIEAIYLSDSENRAMEKVTEKLLILREVELFKNLSAETLYAVANEAKWYEAVKDEKLFSQNDLADNFYIVASAEVTVKRDNEVLNIYSAHDYFGEIGVIGNTLRTADAFVTKDGLLLYIDGYTFINLCLDFPYILLEITRKIASYIQPQHAQVSEH